MCVSRFILNRIRSVARPKGSGRVARFLVRDDDEFITACIEIAAQELSHRATRNHTSPEARDINRRATNRAYQIYVARKARQL